MPDIPQVFVVCVRCLIFVFVLVGRFKEILEMAAVYLSITNVAWHDGM